MVWWKRKRVWIPAVALALGFVMLGTLAVIGHFSTVPQRERIAVRPTPSASQVAGANDPTKETPVIIPIESTDDPAQLAKMTAKLLGGPDAARFEASDYVQALVPVAATIEDDSQPSTAEQTAQTIVDRAWSSDPWPDRAEVKATDTYTPSTVTTVDPETFLDDLAPAGQGSNDQARQYMTSHGLVVMQVDGDLTRQYTDPKTGKRLQQDVGDTPWTIAMLCEPSKDCTVLLALQGKLKAASHG